MRRVLARSHALVVILLLAFTALARASTPPPGTGGLYFDGVNDYVTFGAAPALGVSNFTIEAWFRPLGTGTTGSTGTGGITAVPLVTKGRGENDTTITNCNYFFGIRGSDRVLAADFEDTIDGDNHPVAGTTVVQSNVWQHAAVTYDGTRWVIYFNGRSNGTATTGSTVPRFDSIQHAALGSALNSSGTPQGYFDGVLDEVRLWNAVRTPTQISNNFQLQITNAAGLIGRWSLDETNGTVVTNTGTSGVNGTRISGPVSAAGYPFYNPPLANSPPAAPVLTAPANNATNLLLNATLTATVTDPDADPLTVTFYGRALVTNAAGPDFTIVTLPDTQYYSATTNGGLPAMFQAQTDWIVSNRVASNIVMVTHMGDIVQNGDNGGNNVEWLVATNAMYRMENPLTTLLAHGIPYGVAVGNHDQSPIGDADGTTTFFNQFFGEAHFLGFDYYGGHYGANNDNNFILFSASGLDFILINLEYDTTPSTAVLAWAQGLLNTYTNRRAILTSHYIIGTGNPAAFGAQGQITYDAFKDNRNLSLMLCGHVSGEGRRTDTFDQHTIHTLLADYQGRTDGGSGWLRIMTFSPSNNVVRVQTYSPWLNQFETDANSRFDVPYLMTLPAFAPIATNIVASGNATGANWSGLAPHTPYEWYAVVSDGSLYATSAVRTFRTGAAPPAGTVPQPGDVIFNEYSADNNANGVDFFELLTLTDGLDLRGLRVTENEITNAATGELNNGEPVYTLGADSFLADVPAGTVIAIYTGTNGVVTDTTVNPLAGDWSLVLAPGTGVTSSADGLGGTPTGGLSTTGEALYLYLPGPDGTSAGTDNVYLDYVAWEASASLAPAGITNLAFAAPADNGYFTGSTAAESDLAGFWTIVDAPGGQTPGLANPGQDLLALRGTATPTLTALGAFWKYRDTGVDLGTAWRAAAFDDSLWPSGPAQLGYGDGDEATVVGFGPNAATKYVTTYFRRSFQVANSSNFTALTLRALRDDGIAVYLNGTEVFRNNLAPGAGYATLAIADVGGADESALYSTNVNPALLVEGVNVLAVEIHQDDLASSDISFNLELTGVQSFNGNVPPQVTLTAPANGATFITPVDIAFAATMSDSDGVAKVEFFAAGAKLGEDTAAPFSLVWSNVPAGTNPVFAVATDALGASNVSETITVRIIEPTAGALTRGPYLQLATPTSIVVRWRTDVPTGTRVTYGASPGLLTLTNEDAAFVTEHIVTLTNLAPGARYHYAIGSALGMLAGDDANHFFLTHPVAGAMDPLRVWVIGDAGRADANQTAVRNGFYNFNGTNSVHVWLQLGDNAYNNGTDGEYQAAVFNMYSNQLRNTVTWPAVGNHDTASSTVFSTNYPYFSMFTLPTNAEAGGVPSGLEHYYSFDHGPAHFVCLDSMTSSRATNGAMADWLRADLLANTNRWVIAYFHHPPYTKGSHNSDSLSDSAGAMVEMRENFLPILEAGGVDLVLTGHSHSYERSFLIDGHYNYSSNFSAVTNIVQPGSGRETNGAGAYVKPANFAGPPGGRRGAVYAVAGSSGGTSGWVGGSTAVTNPAPHAAMFISLNLLGSMVLDITSNRLDAIFLREAGAAVVSNDWFTLLKTDFPPVASNVAYAITHDGATNLLLRGEDPNGLPISFTGTSLPTNGLRSAITPASGAFTYTPARGATNGDAFTFTVNDGTSNSAPGVATFIVTAPPDLDGDGLGDAWEALHGVSDPNADNDGDGNSNLAEYWADTNPTNALSWLNIVTITNNGVGQATITWPSVGGVRYRVQFSDGDASGYFNDEFTSIARSLTTEMDAAPAGTPSVQTFTDNFSLTSGPPPNGRRYFRVQLVR